MAALCAWIVAIDRYAPGPEGPSELDVASPIAAAALKLALLLKQREPACSVLLNLSLPALADDQAALTALAARGVLPAAADWTALKAQLALATQADTLLIYWVGHGVLQGERRLLVTAESQTAADLHALDLMSLLTHLRNEARAPLQFGFIDCCGTLLAAVPTSVTLGGSGGVPRAQHFYVSSSAGEEASAATERDGFTQCVLAALAAAPAGPLQPAALHADLIARLNALPDTDSRWTELHFTAGSGELWSQHQQGDAAAHRQLRKQAARAGLSPTALAHLVADAGSRFTLAQVATAVRAGTLQTLLDEQAAQHPLAPEPPLLADAWARVRIVGELLSACEALGLFLKDWRAAVAELRAFDGADTGADHAGSLEALLLATLNGPQAARRRFALACLLELATRRAVRTRPVQAAALRATLQAQADLALHATAAQQQLPPEDGLAYLQASLRVDEATQTASIDAAYLHDGNQALPLDVPDGTAGLAWQLNTLVQAVAVQVAPRQLVVELLAPLNLLCAPRDLLQFEHAALGIPIWLEERWPLALRLRERLLPGTAALFQAAQWQLRHASVRGRLGGAACLTFSPHGAAPAGDVIGLPFPGPAPTDTQRNRKAFITALLDGHPYMCWPRADPTDAAAFEKAVRTLVQAQRLPTLAGALSRAKASGNAELQDLMLLIDEPDRNPLAARKGP